SSRHGPAKVRVVPVFVKMPVRLAVAPALEMAPTPAMVNVPPRLGVEPGAALIVPLLLQEPASVTVAPATAWMPLGETPVLDQFVPSSLMVPPDTSALIVPWLVNVPSVKPPIYAVLRPIQPFWP